MADELSMKYKDFEGSIYYDTKTSTFKGNVIKFPNENVFCSDEFTQFEGKDFFEIRSNFEKCVDHLINYAFNIANLVYRADKANSYAMEFLSDEYCASCGKIFSSVLNLGIKDTEQFSLLAKEYLKDSKMMPDTVNFNRCVQTCILFCGTAILTGKQKVIPYQEKTFRFWLNFVENGYKVI